jgi:hypothetical protein
MLPQETTEVLYGNENIQRRVLEEYSQIKDEHDACIDHTEIAMLVTYDTIWNGLVNLKKRGVRMRCIVEVTLENLIYCKKLTEIARVKHLTGLRSNFGIADRKLCLLHTIASEQQPLSHAIITNLKGIVEAQQYLFETLWSKAIPAEKKVKEIEEGIVPEFIDTLSDNDEINTILHSLLKFTMRELLVILPTANTLFRFKNEGLVQILEEEAKRGIKIRMLIPRHTTDNDNFAKQEITIIQELIKDPLIEVQYLDKPSSTKMIIIVSDTTLSLAIEINNDNAKTTNKAIGLATHSNSESTVLTYVSIFETLWAQAQVKPPITG